MEETEESYRPKLLYIRIALLTGHSQSNTLQYLNISINAIYSEHADSTSKELQQQQNTVCV